MQVTVQRAKVVSNVITVRGSSRVFVPRELVEALKREEKSEGG